MNKSTKILSAMMTAIIVVFFFGVKVFAGEIPEFGPMSGELCHDQATGKFMYHIEKPITIEPEYLEVDLGGICPGCEYKWICGEGGPKLIFHIYGAVNCWFKLHHHGWYEAPGSHVKLEFLPYWWDGATWVSWNLEDQCLPFEDFNGHFTWGAWVCRWYADCLAEEGNYERELTVEVDYCCPGIQ